MSKRINKTNEVLKYLLSHKYLTSIQAFEKWKATRLSSIIHTLREKGYEIETIDTKIDGITFGKYTLKGVREDVRKN